MTTTTGTPGKSVGSARILIVDDHPLVRVGLEARLGSQAGYAVCGCAADTDEALALARQLAPDVIIVDLALRQGSGLDLIKRLRAVGCEAGILVYSAYDECLFAERAVRAGAQGYLSKQEISGSLLDAIAMVRAGQLYLSPAVAQQMATQALRGRHARVGPAALSSRELQIFALIGAGVSTREIATQLHISVHTVESHRENIRAKLHLRNGAELMRHAVQWTLDSTR